jgi:hypothetical protein
VLAARVVHTFGMVEAIGVVWVSVRGIVVRRHIVPPNRVAFGPFGSMVIECRRPEEMPPFGSRLAVLP